MARLNSKVPWEDFQPGLETIWRRPPEEGMSLAVREALVAGEIFKAVVLCEFYKLSNVQFEYLLRGRDRPRARQGADRGGGN